MICQSLYFPFVNLFSAAPSLVAAFMACEAPLPRHNPIARAMYVSCPHRLCCRRHRLGRCCCSHSGPSLPSPASSHSTRLKPRPKTTRESAMNRLAAMSRDSENKNRFFGGGRCFWDRTLKSSQSCYHSEVVSPCAARLDGNPVSPIVAAEQPPAPPPPCSCTVAMELLTFSSITACYLQQDCNRLS